MCSLITIKISIFNLTLQLPLQLDEWWEQPASTVVNWVTADGQNVVGYNHVKKLLTRYDQELLL